MITSLNSLQYEARLQKLGLWTLEERRNRADLIEVFKMAHGFSAIGLPLTDMFLIDTTGRTRGHSLKPTLPDGSRSGPVCHTSRGPYGIPGGYPAVFVRGIQTGPRRDSPSRAVPIRVPATKISRDPHGYRTGRAIPPGTRLDPADKNRRVPAGNPVWAL